MGGAARRGRRAAGVGRGAAGVLRPPARFARPLAACADRAARGRRLRPVRRRGLGALGGGADHRRCRRAGHRGDRSASRAARRVPDLSGALVDELAELLGDPGRLDVHEQPAVILVVGVNGTGKTTTIGKLAMRLREHGHRSSSAQRTRSAPPRRSSSRSGPSARVRRSSAASAGETRPRSRTTRSSARSARAPTSSSSTRPGACTRSRT